MIKRGIAIVFFVSSLVFCYGQQLPHYSQYMHNGFVLNPAVAGIEGCIKSGLNVRKQWMGMPNSPFTQTAFVHGAVGLKNALGLTLFHDVAGAESMLGTELSYAYHAKKTKEELLSLGLAVKVMQYVFNQSTFNTFLPADPVVTNGVQQAIQPDASVGIYYTMKGAYLGLSAQQLLSSTVKTSSITFLKRHYFLLGGFAIPVNKKIIVEPSILLKSMENPYFSFDLNVKAILDKKYIVGFSYRNNDALVFMLGLVYKNLIVAYNYDFVTSKLFKYNSGSHEIFLGYKICRHKGLGEPGKRSVPCPAYN